MQTDDNPGNLGGIHARSTQNLFGEIIRQGRMEVLRNDLWQNKFFSVNSYVFFVSHFNLYAGRLRA